MTKFINKFIVNENIEKVWQFYTDIKHLEIISPKNLNLKIITTTNQTITLGQESTISAKIIIPSIWHSKITFFQKYEYIDEMSTGPFKKWKHIHKFNQIKDNETEVIDEIEFDLPYGIFRKIISIYVNKKLKKLFEYRKDETIKYLNQ